MTRLLAALFVALFLGACASSPHTGRTQFAAPKPVSEAYSEFNMQLLLLATPGAEHPCANPGCDSRTQFDRRVVRVGALLADAANHLYPDLPGRIGGFEFTVADKNEPGTASTASGRIVLLRPVSAFTPNDEALAFIIGREVGHVVAQHHDENAATGLIVSIIAQVLAPVLNFGRIIATLLSGATTTGVVTSSTANAAVTAASIAGSRVLVSTYRPQQREEADTIAVNLLARIGYDAASVSSAFASVDLGSPPTGWVLDLRNSVNRLSANTPAIAASAAAAPEAMVLAR